MAEYIVEAESLEALENGFYAIKSAEPIKRGRWEFNGYYISELSGIIQVKCSKCGFKTLANGLDDYNYCPNCGARMDEEDNQ